MKPETKMNLSETGFDTTPISAETRDRLAQDLTDEERRVLLHHGTEAPFCGTLLDNKEEGVYACRLCGLPLFTSKYKFESGTGWPSFYAPFDKDHLRNIEDNSYGMRRIEIRLRKMRRPSGPCIPGRPAAYRATLLSELRFAGVFR